MGRKRQVTAREAYGRAVELKIKKENAAKRKINGCPDCNGTGKIKGQTCPTCGGEKD